MFKPCVTGQNACTPTGQTNAAQQLVKHVYNQFKYVTVKNRSISTEGPFISLPNVPPLPRGVRP